MLWMRFLAPLRAFGPNSTQILIGIILEPPTASDKNDIRILLPLWKASFYSRKGL
jgi:hypothetical protein